LAGRHGGRLGNQSGAVNALLQVRSKTVAAFRFGMAGFYRKLRRAAMRKATELMIYFDTAGGMRAEGAAVIA